LNISEAAGRSGLPAKTIRYYEEIGLVAPLRAGNGYREYRERDIARLRFLGRARQLGFSIPECRMLLSLSEDASRSSAEVKEIALQKVAEIDAKLAELAVLRETLAMLADRCHGDGRPECPIIEALAGHREAAKPSAGTVRGT
jgi:Cu(I)-responsive transcriptional regulator